MSYEGLASTENFKIKCGHLDQLAGPEQSLYLLSPRLSLDPSGRVQPEELALGLLVADGLLRPVGRATHEARHGRALHGRRLVLDRHRVGGRKLFPDRFKTELEKGSARVVEDPGEVLIPDWVHRQQSDQHRVAHSCQTAASFLSQRKKVVAVALHLTI